MDHSLFLSHPCTVTVSGKNNVEVVMFYISFCFMKMPALVIVKLELQAQTYLQIPKCKKVTTGQMC
ncbi:hypothetical protein AB205_0174470 [Aquarana catesbeiana]|uniref:Uncharacterized protein n=1 Tax=Aquarana catesbeiana TaxID=8400 RepID=A0A2G9S6X4_AQUCT|nr:hypothetical protein AB205_0174470 [Aquarana catesbeiana]